MIFVALFTRAWIEIAWITPTSVYNDVALFTRAWIEILNVAHIFLTIYRRPLHEGVD